jgi:antitoxin StbD
MTYIRYIKSTIKEKLMQRIHARSTVSISELKKNPTSIITHAHGEPVAILNHNRPTAYLVPAAVFEAMMEQLDDLELARLVRERSTEASVKVHLDEL